MIEKKELISIGKFLKTHALKGELNAVFDIVADAISAEMPLVVEMEGIPVPFYIETIRGKGQYGSLVKLDGIDTEADAKAFVNKIIYILKTDYADISGDDAEEDEYADALIGYTVIDYPDNIPVGVITALDTTTQNALFIIETDDETVYIPVSEDFIIEINDDKQIITMNLPDGLVDLNKK